MTDKTIVTLIGGKFHRQKIEISKNQVLIKMPIPPSLTAKQFYELTSIPEPIDFVTYSKVGSIFGEYGIFPDDCFIDITIDIVQFLKNLVKDYVR